MSPCASIRINRPEVGCGVVMASPLQGAGGGRGTSGCRAERPAAAQAGRQVGPSRNPQSASRVAGELRKSATGHGNWRLTNHGARRAPHRTGRPQTRGRHQPLPPGSDGRKKGSTACPGRCLTDAVEGEPLEVCLRMSGIVGNGPRNRNLDCGFPTFPESKAGNLRCQAFLQPAPAAAIPSLPATPAPPAGFRRPDRPNSLTEVPQPVD